MGKLYHLDFVKKTDTKNQTISIPIECGVKAVTEFEDTNITWVQSTGTLTVKQEMGQKKIVVVIKK